jgi:hypothetical protein
VQDLLKADVHQDVGFIGVASTSEALAEVCSPVRRAPNLILIGWTPHSDTVAVLHHVKHNEHLRAIPTLVIGAGMRASDTKSMYDDGAACVINLPDTLAGLERTFGIINEFWLNHVRLPREPEYQKGKAFLT